MPGHEIAREACDDQCIPESPPSRCIQGLLASVDQEDLSEDPYDDEVFCPLRNSERARQNEPGESRDENYDGPEEESSSGFREARGKTFHLYIYGSYSNIDRGIPGCRTNEAVTRNRSLGTTMRNSISYLFGISLKADVLLFCGTSSAGPSGFFDH